MVTPSGEYFTVKKGVKTKGLYKSIKLVCTCSNEIIASLPFKDTLVCNICNETIVEWVPEVLSEESIEINKMIDGWKR